MAEKFVMSRQITGRREDLLLNSSPLPSSSLSSPPLRRSPRLRLRMESSLHDFWTTMMSLETAKRSRKEKEKGDYISGNMDQEIWKEFPQDLFEAVLSRLPITTFFQFRSVCRTWNALIHSDIFSQRCNELSHTTKPWFCAVINKNHSLPLLYDPSLEKWHQPVTIPALAENLCSVPVASAGGLVCFHAPGDQKLYVTNPLTKSLRELPANFNNAWSSFYVGMTLNGNSTSHGYKILWLRSGEECEVYDSLTMTWTKPGTIPSNIKLPLSRKSMSKPVAIHSTLYFMLRDPEGILSYDMVSEKWKQYFIPIPPHSSDHSLAVHGERLMLVGMVTKKKATCVCIWELQKITLLWKEVDRMPNEWSLDLYDLNFMMSCLGNKGCLILLSLSARGKNRHVIYNVVTREWTKLIGCTILGRSKIFKDLKVLFATSFHPNPAAKA